MVKKPVEGNGCSRFDVSQIDFENLLGRPEIKLEAHKTASYLRGKRVLVTGAGGSIGAQLCRHLAALDISQLLILDHDETAIQQTQLSLQILELPYCSEPVLADIRDSEALQDIFQCYQPEVVFHAAALKHLPMLERYPLEAWKTNVLGTLNLLRAAQVANVETFVNISTDKAANPISALGHSKRVAERLTAWASEITKKSYISVRFGNIIGSRGSVLPIFLHQIARSLPLTISHPEATRFFMTPAEACELVLRAGAIGRLRQVLVLDVGAQIKIIDIAKRLMAQCGAELEIVYTGLGGGEKMHEVLLGRNETDFISAHEKIFQAEVTPLSPEMLNREFWLRRVLYKE